MIDIQELRAAVRKAAQLYNDDYDAEAADAAQEKEAAEFEQRTPEGDDYACMSFRTDYNNFYRKTLEEWCEEVAPGYGRLIFLALDGRWNDTLDWADEK